MTILKHDLKIVKAQSFTKAERYYHLYLRKYINLTNEESQRTFDAIAINALAKIAYNSFNEGYEEYDADKYFKVVILKKRVNELKNIIMFLISVIILSGVYKLITMYL